MVIYRLKVSLIQNRILTISLTKLTGVINQSQAWILKPGVQNETIIKIWVQGLSQDLETGGPKLAKSCITFGHSIF